MVGQQLDKEKKEVLEKIRKQKEAGWLWVVFRYYSE